MTRLDLNQQAIVDEPKRFDPHEEIDRVVEDLKERLGIETYPKPKSTPKPLADADISKLTNVELEQLYIQYTAYTSYLVTQLAILKQVEYSAKNRLTHVAAEIKNELYTKKVPKDMLASRTKTHEVYVEVEHEYDKAKMMHTILEAYYKAYSKQAQGLSRVVELRKQEFDESLRSGNIGRTRGPRKMPSR